VWEVEPRLVIALRIVTCWPPETGVTAVILLTVLPYVVLYFQTSPTPTGNGTVAVVSVVDPLELGLCEAAGELLPALFPAALPELDDPPHPARANPAVIATTAAAPARPRGLTALRLMFLFPSLLA
jgi:hypothetical protein